MKGPSRSGFLEHGEHAPGHEEAAENVDPGHEDRQRGKQDQQLLHGIADSVLLMKRKRHRNPQTLNVQTLRIGILERRSTPSPYRLGARHFFGISLIQVNFI